MSHNPALLLIYALLVIFWVDVAVLFVRSIRTRRRYR